MLIKKLTSFRETSGDLIPIEFYDVPFPPKRAFIVKDTPLGAIRGNHAHYLTRQYLICLQGRIRVFIHDGIKLNKGILKRKHAVYIDNLLWDYQEFITGNDILLVLCSTPFDKKDYISDFDKFLRIKKDINDKHKS